MRRDPGQDQQRLTDYAATTYAVVCPSCDLDARVAGSVAAAQIVATHVHADAVAVPTTHTGGRSQ